MPKDKSRVALHARFRSALCGFLCRTPSAITMDETRREGTGIVDGRSAAASSIKQLYLQDGLLNGACASPFVRSNSITAATLYCRYRISHVQGQVQSRRGNSTILIGTAPKFDEAAPFPHRKLDRAMAMSCERDHIGSIFPLQYRQSLISTPAAAVDGLFSGDGDG
jgi:hypothetical protein